MGGIKVAQKVNSNSKIVAINFINRRRVLRFFFIISLFVAVFCLCMKFLITPVIIKTGTVKINELSNKSINGAIKQVMLGTVCYDDLIHIVTDGSGKIVLLQANSIIINSLTQEVIENTYESLFNSLYDPLHIPLGSFSGIPAFASSGPKIDVDIVPYGTVSCKFLSKFTSCGINQTLHQIYASVETNVSAVLPLKKINCVRSEDILVAESLIIGDIPSTYLMAEDKSDLLNMVG